MKNKHYVKLDGNPNNLSTAEPKYDKVTVEVKRTVLKKMAQAVNIQKGSPSQIVQAFLNHALTL
jgi:hypothetical protein